MILIKENISQLLSVMHCQYYDYHSIYVIQNTLLVLELVCRILANRVSRVRFRFSDALVLRFGLGVRVRVQLTLELSSLNMSPQNNELLPMF